MSYFCPNCNSSPLEDYVWWVSGGVRFVKKKHDWKQPNRLLVVQTGESVEQAKVFKAHAIPQGFVRKFDHRAEIAGESARGWRRSPTKHCDKPRQRKQERSHGRLAGLHQGGQSSRLGCWRATPRHGNLKSSEAKCSGRRVGCYNQGKS